MAELLRANVGLALVLSPIAVFAIAAYRRRWMHDDGFIDLRIVRNVLEGHGFVFNVGERIEATTSALWVLLLVVLGAIGARLEDAAVYLGLACSTAALGLAELAAFRRASGDASPAKNRWILPLGCALYAALPPAWDFATSGLETGLALLWLSGSYFAVVTLGSGRHRGRSSGWWFAAAALIGLGWLIRPELALYAVAMLGPLSSGFDAKLRAQGAASFGRAKSAIVFLFFAAALPAGYQIFRMGYFGATTANPAFAKEAFRANVPQGWCYFKNFFGLYGLAVPVAALVLVVTLDRRRRLPTSPALGKSGWVSALLVAAAAAHVGYIVAMGGDYMHGRMFLPPVFAASLPFSVVVMSSPEGVRRAPWLRFSSAVALLVWAVYSATSLRVDPANQCDIGDERGWYVAQAKRENPVHVEDFVESTFYGAGRRFLGRLAVNCPSALWPSKDLRFGCRRTIDLESEQGDELAVDRADKLIGQPIDSEVAAVAAYGAIGIVGYLLPSSVLLVDRHGLADPLGARLKVSGRGRPGHEKRLTDPWILARFTGPAPGDDAALVAARHALGCWRIPTLLERIQAPLTGERFLKNIALAMNLHRLRIPADPFIAEERFCQAKEPTRFMAGGEGGAPFEWRSPSGVELVGIQGAIDDSAGALAEMGPLFQNRRGASREGGAEAPLIEGKRKGKSKEHRFDLKCPEGTILVGLRGRANNLVRQLGLLCSEIRPVEHQGRIETPLVGIEGGEPFELVCPEETELIGVTGRSGSLIDATGLVCGARTP